MNSLWQQHGELLKSTQELRRDLFAVLPDADLASKLPGTNPTLGELCQEMGEIEQSYVDSFKTFTQDLSYRYDDPTVATSLAKLSAWCETLDQDLNATLEALSEADLQKPVDRGHGFAPPVGTQFHIYREALLIFYAKVHIYLRALEKTVPTKWQWWIGDRADWPQG